MPAGSPAPRRRRALTLRPVPGDRPRRCSCWPPARAARVVVGDRDADAAAARCALAPLARGGAAEGKLRVARAGGRATLAVSGLAPSRRGEFYELWLLSPPGDLVSLGSFRVGASGRATLERAGARSTRRGTASSTSRWSPTTATRRTPRARSCAGRHVTGFAARPHRTSGLHAAHRRGGEGGGGPAVARRRRRGARPSDRRRRLRRRRSTASTSRRSPRRRAPSSRELAETTVDGFVERLRAAGVEAEGDVRAGPRASRGAALRRGEGRGRDRLRRARPRAGSPAACSAASRST